MQPMTVSVGPLAAAAANNICLSQTPSGAGYLTLNGSLVSSGVAVLDTPRRILLTTNANETAKTFTVVGTNWSGAAAGEVITGVTSSTVASVLDYKTVLSIYASAATTAAITFGTTTTAASPWVRFDGWGLPQAAVQCVKTGTINYTVQQTLDDPNSPTSPVAMSDVTWASAADTALVGATGSVAGSFSVVPVFARILLNSGSGSVIGTFLQLGNDGYTQVLGSTNPTRTVTGTSDTPTIYDNGGLISFTSGSAITVTANDLGANIAYSLEQQGAGQITVAAGSGITLISDKSSASFVSARQGAVLTCISDGAGNVFVIGNTA